MNNNFNQLYVWLFTLLTGFNKNVQYFLYAVQDVMYKHNFTNVQNKALATQYKKDHIITFEYLLT